VGFPASGGFGQRTSSSFDQYRGVTPDRLAPADVADVLAGLGLHAHGINSQAEQRSNVVPNPALDGPELRLLGEDRNVEVDRPPARLVQPAKSLGNEPRRVSVLVGRIGVGEQFTDVSEGSGPEQCIGHRVQHHVRVAVAGESAGMFNADAAQDERAALHQPVRVVPAAHSQEGRHPIPNAPSPA
jgi:hypothetical protein